MKSFNSWAIEGGKVIDPLSGTEKQADVFITKGVISYSPDRKSKYKKIKANNLFITPPLIDLHVHFREPGNCKAETILTGSISAMHGGFGTVVAMPNTVPPIDSEKMVEFIKKLTKKTGINKHFACRLSYKRTKRKSKS